MAANRQYPGPNTTRGGEQQYVDMTAKGYDLLQVKMAGTDRLSLRKADDLIAQLDVSTGLVAARRRKVTAPHIRDLAIVT